MTPSDSEMALPIGASTFFRRLRPKNSLVEGRGLFKVGNLHRNMSELRHDDLQTKLYTNRLRGQGAADRTCSASFDHLVGAEEDRAQRLATK